MLGEELLSQERLTEWAAGVGVGLGLGVGVGDGVGPGPGVGVGVGPGVVVDDAPPAQPESEKHSNPNKRTAIKRPMTNPFKSHLRATFTFETRFHET